MITMKVLQTAIILIVACMLIIKFDDEGDIIPPNFQTLIITILLGSIATAFLSGICLVWR